MLTLKSVSDKKLKNIHAILCVEFKVDSELILRPLGGCFHGHYVPSNDRIVVNTKITDKGGTLCHEWAHLIALKKYGSTGHNMGHARIQKWLMLRFGIKFRVAEWESIRPWKIV